MTPLHSYYPVGVEIPSYVHNEWSTLTLVRSAKTIATNKNPHITIAELSIVLWFTLCGSIHLILEGYYALNFATLPGSQQLLAQLWKEYSMSDSRYLTSHAFVMSMESVTAWFWGPLSFVLASFIVTENPFRHPLQIIISTGQLYGDVLYYGTCAFDFLVYGVEYSRPEGYYFYGYFVLLNGFWIVIPILLIAHSVRACGRVFAEAKRVSTVGINGDAKKTS
ncbi:Emopamil-binding [Penicillium psychrosexuale]|uniref:Emopamil-binding n=1 Tax=Penicillium psychrosexuale TaxID=1002107 RepID=UPI002544DEC9|nr:Emopamil-binding [Penicillium psychrosexuale]KAJ5800488.1 Emopamil-binding [Penicillium psychrosexuale]